MITRDDVARSLKQHGYSGAIICLHASLSSFGEVDNGPFTIIDGCLADRNTLVAPVFYYDAETFPPICNYERNGILYAEKDFSPIAYQALPEQVDTSMGIIPRTMLGYPDAVRSQHPCNSFVALGPRAQAITDKQYNLNVYAIYENILNEKNDAYIFLAGVDLTSCTPIHFAEELAGKNLFRRWVLHEQHVEEVEVGGCSCGFEALRDSVKELESVIMIGDSRVSIFPFGAFVTRITEVIKDNPSITKCGSPSCLRCRDMAAGGPVFPWKKVYNGFS